MDDMAPAATKTMTISIAMAQNYELRCLRSAVQEYVRLVTIGANPSHALQRAQPSQRVACLGHEDRFGYVGLRGDTRRSYSGMS